MRNDELEKMLRHFEPSELAPHAGVSRARSAARGRRSGGQNGLKLRLSTGNGELEAIGWGRRIALETSIQVPVALPSARTRRVRGRPLQARIAILSHLSSD